MESKGLKGLKASKLMLVFCLNFLESINVVTVIIFRLYPQDLPAFVTI